MPYMLVSVVASPCEIPKSLNYLLARQTDGAAVQLPPKPSGHPSALARQELFCLFDASWFIELTPLFAKVRNGSWRVRILAGWVSPVYIPTIHSAARTAKFILRPGRQDKSCGTDKIFAIGVVFTE